MIVCVCHNVSEKKIQRAYDAGMTTFAAIRDNLEVGTCCGKCAGCARQVLRECAQQPAAQSGLQLLLHKLQMPSEAMPA